MKTPEYYLEQKNNHRTQLFISKELWRELRLVAIKEDEPSPGSLIRKLCAVYVCSVQDEEDKNAASTAEENKR